VLRAAELAGVPAVELRAISNAVTETNRDRWSIDDALAALGTGLDALLQELEHA
jgi:futalosine hydrolase